MDPTSPSDVVLQQAQAWRTEANALRQAAIASTARADDLDQQAATWEDAAQVLNQDTQAKQLAQGATGLGLNA